MAFLIDLVRRAEAVAVFEADGYPSPFRAVLSGEHGFVRGVPGTLDRSR